MFNKQAAAFYRIYNHEPKASDFRPNETRAASLFYNFKDISVKACLNSIVREGNLIWYFVIFLILSNGPDKKERTKTQWTRRNAKRC